MKIRRFIALLVASLSLVAVFLSDLIRKAIADHSALNIDAVHSSLILLGYSSLVVFFLFRDQQSEINPIKLVGRVMLIAMAVLFLTGLIALPGEASFFYEEGTYVPKNYATLIAASFLSVTACIAAIVLLIAIADLFFIKRRRYTKRNFVILLSAGGVYLLYTFLAGAEPQDDIGIVLGVLLKAIIVINTFRLAWIVHLSRREKLYTLLYSFFGTIAATMLTIFSYEASNLLSQSLIYYHPAVHAYVSSVFLLTAVYMGFSFVTTLFQLPSADAFDRKKVEISSLHNMSRLITRVLDYDELVQTAINLSLDVSDGNAAWLKLTRGSDRPTVRSFVTVDTRTDGIIASKNTDRYDVAGLFTNDGTPLDSFVYESAKPLVIHSFANDRRVRHLKAHRKSIGSMAILPLLSHDKLIGTLGIIKQLPYGFDRDTINALLAFTDLVTIAIENNKLIGESITKERLEQELMVAQQMQQKLLPQQLPAAEEFEMCAISLPAYEVGGDYYDVVQLTPTMFGLVIGDVSGKGVSAALYMAQVKGIFQSLSASTPGTKELLINTNAALFHNIERKAFVSLLYATIDTASAAMTLARAGHCPLLLVRHGRPQFLRPNGIGLGLDNSERFSHSIEEQHIALEPDDLLILYTDGITEAKNDRGEEFGYESFAAVVASAFHLPPQDLMHHIIQEVKSYTGGGAADDDITLLLFKWRGNARGNTDQEVHQKEIEQEVLKIEGAML